MTRAKVMVLLAIALAGCGGNGLDEERRGDLVYASGGEGPGHVTVIRPENAQEPLPVVLFLHGWGATQPRFYGPWLEHLARAGNAVIYPRYQDSFAEPPTQVLGNVLVGMRTALEHADVDAASLVVAGHSAGGALAADYAAVARRVGLPPPRAVLSIYPGRAFRGIRAAIPAAGPVPGGAELVVLSGSDDNVVDPRDARAIYSTAETEDRELDVITVRGASDHIGPQRATPVARREFWRRLDALITRARASSARRAAWRRSRHRGRRARRAAPRAGGGRRTGAASSRRGSSRRRARRAGSRARRRSRPPRRRAG
jgi:dienelactone hydrolase